MEPLYASIRTGAAPMRLVPGAIRSVYRSPWASSTSWEEDAWGSPAVSRGNFRVGAVILAPQSSAAGVVGVLRSLLTPFVGVAVAGGAWLGARSPAPLAA